jgi:uncharacterized OB-fold protein
MENPMLKGPRPKPTRDTKPYWDGLQEGRLLIQQCADCETFRHYPRPVCPNCYSMEVKWRDMQGQGTVHTWTTSYHAFNPAFKKDLPTTYVTVDLPEGPRMVGRLCNSDPADLVIGKPVKLSVEYVDDELSLPIVELIKPS